MNNEGKIISMLESLTSSVTNLQDDVSDLKQTQVCFDKNQAILEKAVNELRRNTDRTAQMPVKESLAILERGMSRVQDEISEIKQEVSEIKEDISEIKEGLEEVRSGTNTLLEWAERSERILNVPLMPKAK